MSTAMMNRTQESAGNWQSMFPTEQTTETQSAVFVKKLLAIAVSNITYLRGIFPERAFADRCLEDLNLKILRDSGDCPGACQVIQWVKGCFDALDKKYLKMLIIGIYVDPSNPDDVIESYTFKFSYADNTGVEIYRNNKKVSSAQTTAETKKATIRLLRTIVVLSQSLHSLPDEVMMTMKLLYYDDVTPSDYEPPGFISAEKDSFDFEDEPMNIKVGDVTTPFHTVKVRIKTDGKQFQMEEDMCESKEQCPEGRDEQHAMSQPMNEDPVHDRFGGVQNVNEPIEADSAPKNTPSKPGSRDEAVNNMPPSSQGSQINSEQDFGVRCPCGCNEDDGLMVLCAACKFWQHALCFGIKHQDEAPARHICESCSIMDNPNLRPTDRQLYGLTEVQVQAICLWRRALMACKEMNRVLAVNMSRRLGVETTVAQGLVNRLEKEGCIKAPGKGKRLGKTVDRQKLERSIERYFPQRVTEEEVTEDEADQDSTMNQEPEVEGSPEKKAKVQKNVDSEIDDLTSQASEITLTGRKQKGKSGRSSQKLKGRVYELKEGDESSRKRGRKRVKAVSEDHDFDLCDSEVSQREDSVQIGGGGGDGRKKRKASIAGKPILV